MKDTFYCLPPRFGDTVQRANGKALNELVSFFQPATPQDGELIRSFFATCFWGGAPRARPAFLIEAHGRGQGKTVLATTAAKLAGGDDGLMMVSAAQDVDVLYQRLLSPGAAGKRLMLLDNVKASRFSWAAFEALLTSPTISGKALYVGEASRPNTVVWAITMNDPVCSTDIATRVVTIKLGEVDYVKGWLAKLDRFVESHRWQIIADIVRLLRSKGKPLSRHTRWEPWECDVLSKMIDPESLVETILARQQAVDAEAEEWNLVIEGFRERLDDLNYGEDDIVFVPSKVATVWLSEILAPAKRIDRIEAGRKLGQLIGERGSKAVGDSWKWLEPNRHGATCSASWARSATKRRRITTYWTDSNACEGGIRWIEPQAGDTGDRSKGRSVTRSVTTYVFAKKELTTTGDTMTDIFSLLYMRKIPISNTCTHVCTHARVCKERRNICQSVTRALKCFLYKHLRGDGWRVIPVSPLSPAVASVG